MNNFGLGSYSIEGEDIILKRIFEYNRKIIDGGFYIDIGAHHPQRFSNTYFFYKRGWRGINIDANPGSMKLFNEQRPNDINVECAISEKPESLTYYMFNESALNTFDHKLAMKYSLIQNYKIIEKRKITTKRLDELLKEHNVNEEIDFITIDVEGFDFAVLQSINWEIYRPKVVLFETQLLDMDTFYKDEACQFMIMKNYVFLSKTVGTVFFIRQDYFKQRFNALDCIKNED